METTYNAYNAYDTRNTYYEEINNTRRKAATLLLVIFIIGFAFQVMMTSEQPTVNSPGIDGEANSGVIQPVDTSLEWLRKQMVFQGMLAEHEGLVHATHPTNTACSVMIFDSASGGPSGWLCFTSDGMSRINDTQLPLEMQQSLGYSGTY